MKLNEAVAQARRHLTELFSGQRISGIGVEAIVFDDHLRVWSITLGFSRPDEGGEQERRMIRLADADGHVISAN